MTTTMMLHTPLKEKQANMQGWKTVFPDFTTLEGSCLFVKKLIAVSLSSITFLRRIFPEEAYGEINLNGLKVKVLNENCGIKSVKKFIDLIRSCYDAVERKYLQQMSIGICASPDNMDEVIEAYNLVFRYTEDECSITCNNGEKTKTPLQNNPTVQATFLLLKSIYTITDLLTDLPKKPYISVKLLYYDDVTPPDYEPQGFEPSSTAKFTFPGKTMNLKLGKVMTDRHSYQCLLKSTATKQSASQYSQEDPISNSAKSGCGYEKVNGNTHETDKDLESDKVQALEKSNKSLHCPCGLKCVDSSDMIICFSCDKVQHKSCYGFLESESNPPVFYCVECILYNSDGHTSLDLVYTYRGKEREDFCCMRRALNFCLLNQTFTNGNFEKYMGCIKPVAKVLLQRLEVEGFISKGPRNKYVVDESIVNSHGLTHYFSMNDENIENEEQVEEDSDLEIDTVQSPEEYEDTNHSESLLKASIDKVKALSLDESSKRTSRKRKSSFKAVSPAASEELFQSQTKRTRRRL